MREMHTWSKADHPHVLKLLGVAQYQDRLAMVSPWVEHGTVLQYIKAHVETDCLALCTQVADGLAYLHSIPLAHGDIKAENVLISREGTALLADFGGAKLGECSLEFSGSQPDYGSPHYQAPEYFDGRGPTPQADVYALAVTIVTILSGGSVPKRTVGGVPKRPPLPILGSNAGSDILQSLLNCWQADPQQRPSATDIYQEMKKVTGERRQLQSRESTTAATAPEDNSADV
ncbi:hypothetical protein FRC12_010626 [Ceratobasidium sp. 428]|nr:hypothetical protein FRC12_010626 [Ceratobasidium sp. 428]